MIIGIDLGTSNSLAAVYRDGEVQLIHNGRGDYNTPSVVAVDENGLFYTGEVAKEKRQLRPENTADKFKRSMGTNDIFPMGIFQMTAEELSAVVLKKLKDDASNFLGEEVTDAIISVPAFYNNPQREAVLKAGRLAGLNVRKIINEPTSAALAYGLQNMDDENERVIIVLDLGGGTFDISIMEVAGSVMEVVAICGDNKLGGNDFTDKLVDAFLSKNNISDKLTSDDYTKLWKVAEKAKISISENGKASMNYIIDNEKYNMDITETEYEQLCYDLLNNIRRLTLRAIDESKYFPNEISDVILVGGGTKLSIVKKMMEKMIGKELTYHINPDEAVVRGAAMQGALMEQNEYLKDLVMTDICPYYIMKNVSQWRGNELVKCDSVLIDKNTVIPTKLTFNKKVDKGNGTVKIYQSEDKYGNNSTLIGTLNYVAPAVKEDTTEVIHTIMYDNNGILVYEVYVPETDKLFTTSILSNNSSVNVKEINRRMKELKQLKVSNGAEEKNALLIAVAENLYTELLGRDRETLSHAISDFESSLATKKKRTIEEARKRLEAVIDEFQ